MANAEKKIGCYICKGCGIGEALDVDALASLATDDCDAASSAVHPCLCAEEGLELIRKEIADGVNSVVVAACSMRAKRKEFALPDVVVERVNLREGVAWIAEANAEPTQRLAADYVRMGIIKAGASEVPAPFGEGEFCKDLLVVGGGPAGMTAALEAAKAGYQTTLVERAEDVGGFAAKLHKSVPTKGAFRELEETEIGGLIDAVKSHPKIELLTAAEVSRIDGAPCKFEVELTAGGQTKQVKAGAIVLASGFTPYDPAKLGHLGYGQYPDVVTNVEFEEMVKKGELKRPSDGGSVDQVLFLQCAGSRDEEHLAYCSGYCCATALKQATYVKQQNPEARTFVLYKDIRTPDRMEEFYREVQRQGTIFVRGELKELSKPNGKLKVTATDALLDETVEYEDLDLVVLATGMVSTNLMEGEKVEPLTGDGAQQPKALKLNYRQGPELPNLRYGAPDSHYICFPYETRRTGIYAAGTVRRPMNATDAKRDAMGAALKAIQCVEMTSRGEAVHPRAGDQSYPEFFMQRCTQCKRCTEECPFGAINEDEKANPLPNPTRCRRCGVCMGACPERIISFADYSVGAIGNMIKAIEVPDEDEDEEFAVVALVCENDAYPLLDRLAQARTQLHASIRVIPLRCLGSTNLVWVGDALSKGIDGMLFLGCKHGDDYQCHFIKGSELCQTRLSNVQDTLERLALEPERIRFEEITTDDFDRLPKIISEFMETMENVGPNPYRGF